MSENLFYDKVDDYNYTISLDGYHLATIRNSVNGVTIEFDLCRPISFNEISFIYSKMESISRTDFVKVFNSKLTHYNYFLEYDFINESYELYKLNDDIEDYIKSFYHIDEVINYVRNTLKLYLNNT